MQRCADVFHCYLVLADEATADLAVVDKTLADLVARAGWAKVNFVEQTGATRHLHTADMRLRATAPARETGPAEVHLAISAEDLSADTCLLSRLAALVHALLDVLDVAELR